jgi:hypothetical protein
MNVTQREQVRDILLAHGFKRSDFDEAFWPNEAVEKFLQDPRMGMQWFSKQNDILRWEMDERM